MKISYITLFPEFYNGFKDTSIIKKAIENKHIEMNFVNFKDYVSKGRVDDKIVGGGKGNLIRYDVASSALNSVKTSKSKVVLLTPRGKTFNQKTAKELAKVEELIFICPHFEGIDARIEDEVDYCLSIGDYILTGGEIASMVVSDSVIRLIDGVINKESLNEESFENILLEYDQYALPRSHNGKDIPDVYLSGNHKEIAKYKKENSLEKTKKNRPDLYEKYMIKSTQKCENKTKKSK